MSKTRNSDEKGLVPRLRFPAFAADAPWNSNSLGNLASFNKGAGLPKSAIVSDGKRACIHYGELFLDYGEVITQVNSWTDLGSQLVTSQYGDVLMPTSDVTPTGLAKASCVLLPGVILGGDILIIRVDQEVLNGQFIARFIRREERNVLRLVNGTTVFHLYPNSIAKLQLAVPSLPEQQKIAACLASLDDRIAAETRQLDALKTHKQGLLQQLFPRENETVPRLRFPTVRESSGWQQTTINGLGEIVTGSTPSTAKREYYGGDFLFVSPADISDSRFVEATNMTLTGDGFVMTRRVAAGSTMFVCIGSTIGKVAQPRVECATNQQINSVMPSGNFVGEFVFYLLLREAKRISELAGKQAVPIINKSTFASVSVRYPTRLAQQKIADCLTSLDDLIAAQTKKIDLLKWHKRGLMQQLFPELNEAA